MAGVWSLTLGIFLAGITLEILAVPAWDPRVQRYVGYDLERGPVLYEAYYPDEQTGYENQKSAYQEKRYFDRGTVLERSYQVPEDPYELPYDSTNAKPSQSQPQSRDFERPNLPYIASNDRNYESAMGPSDQEYPREVSASSYGPNDKLNVPSRDPAYEQGSRDYLTENKENTGYLIPARIPYIREVPDAYNVPADEIIFGEPPSVQESQVRTFENKFDEPRTYEYAPRRREVNPIPLKRSNPRNLQLRSSEVNLVDESFRNPTQYGETDFQKGYNENYKDFRQTPDPVPMENIFAPRPQIINYVLSPMKKSDSIASTSAPVISATEPERNQWPRNYGDNLINDDIMREDENELRKDEAKVTSIEISEVPHHKIRHHHGERPKRNYSHK